MFVFVEKGVHVGGRVPAGKPFRPVGDVGAVANAIGPPAVVGVADKVVILAKCTTEVSIAIREPVFACGVVDEDQLESFGRGATLRRGGGEEEGGDEEEGEEGGSFHGSLLIKGEG